MLKLKFRIFTKHEIFLKLSNLLKEYFVNESIFFDIIKHDDYLDTPVNYIQVKLNSGNIYHKLLSKV